MKVSDIFADYDYRNQADKLWNSVPMIPLNGMKSRATGFQWQKIDGSPLKYTREFETVDIDYGFTAFTENTIRSKAPNEKNKLFKLISDVMRDLQQNLICVTPPNNY